MSDSLYVTPYRLHKCASATAMPAETRTIASDGNKIDSGEMGSIVGGCCISEKFGRPREIAHLVRTFPLHMHQISTA